jgi:hypothetical protein
MAKITSASLLEFFSRNRIVMLLAAILIMIIGSPFLDEIFPHAVIPDLFITIIFVLGLYAISQKKMHIYISLGLIVPMFIGVWSAHLYESPGLSAWGHFFGALYIAFVISLLIKFIFNEKEVTKEVIFAAVVVYLLMAMMWSNAYLILEFFNPGSFSIPENPTIDAFKYLYFSFVTITTLGYGDVAPLTHKASSLVILEAVVGQIYLVVIVAWLVGMHVSQKTRN